MMLRTLKLSTNMVVISRAPCNRTISKHTLQISEQKTIYMQISSFLYTSKRFLTFTIELNKGINPTPSETRVCLAFPLPSEPRSMAYKSGRLLCVPRVGNMGHPNLVAMRTDNIVRMTDNKDLGAGNIAHRLPIIRIAKDYH